MTRSRLVLLAALLLLSAGALVAWRSAPPRVPAVELRAAPLSRTLQFSARVTTPSRVDVGSTVTGRVLQVLVAEGAAVRAGEPLLRLDSEELQAARVQAEAGERQAAARLRGLLDTGRKSAQAGLAQTASVRGAAEAELRRVEELVAQGFLSASRQDEARRALAVAEAQQAGAQAQRSALDEGGTDIAQARAQLAAARAASALAVARLAQAEIVAPADARVLVRAVEPGQIVQPGRALLSLALAGPLQLQAQVDERYLEQLQPGQGASVLADAFPGQRFSARVQSIAPLVDAQRGAVLVKFALPAPPAFLREDMTLSVEVETARRERALAVPVAALRGETGAGTAEVLIEREGRVEARTLRLGLRTLEAAEVLEGLAAGDRVLIGPAPAPGQRVRAEPASRGPGQAATAPSPGSAGAALTNAMGR